ncbi:alpha/beta fold hydrolase [Sphingosinicella sp. CPCC 101087]|uniref:alpha/beta fold hydrolase n=1 Tax=Sphingosinicella sp. CPCC 101087 TaxID=2497754 RepID=UPI00101D304D|nr:alpha/beta hydrolase [Sphingosinicella sp. CPCC 101087]
MTGGANQEGRSGASGPTGIALPTGVTLAVQASGPREAEPIVLLHGFPESHRTWRAVAPELARDHFVVAPDQRGFAGSDKPEGIEPYRTERMVEDLIALADVLDLKRFTLVGHDWGGAVAWLAALRHPGRIARLVAINAPHPLIFQKSLIEDEAQRAASQYIQAFRNPAIEAGIAAMGLDTFFDTTFGRHADLSKIPPEERQAYIDQWSQPGALTAMLNWYRASEVVVPKPGDNAALPAWTHLPFPQVKVPTLVVWGLKDQALLPIQLGGLDTLVDDLRVAATPEAGHFIPWEAPEFVVAAIRDFVAETPA